MSIYTNPPEWEDAGKKPPSSKRTEGWRPGDRVPASWLNWFWFSTANSLREIAQAFVSHRESTSDVHGVPEGETIATKRYVDGRVDGLADGLDAHVTDKNNPHGVTAEQIGAAPSDATIPAGGIIMWSGSVDSIPPGWALCDGRNGTPDLRDRFIVGAGGSYDVGDTGGAESVTLTVAQMPQHSHGASSSSAGSHTHSISTSSAGSHSHSASPYVSSSSYRNFIAADAASLTQFTPDISGAKDARTFMDNSVAGQLQINMASAGSHSHSGTAASAGSHSHSITVNNTGSSQPHENRPPYYALCFIMKL